MPCFPVPLLVFVVLLAHSGQGEHPPTASGKLNPMLVVQIEKPATLPCLVSDPSTARWMFTPPGSADGTNKYIVANGKTMMRNFVDFIIVSDQAHQYDLNIRRVRFTDAGSYFCKDESNMATIELVVLDDQPTCNIPPPKYNTGVHRPGQAVINCTIQYKGNWAPNIGWTLRNNKKEIKSFKTTNETFAVVENHATSLISVTIDPSMRGSNFICETTVGLHTPDFNGEDSNKERLEIICPSFPIADYEERIAHTDGTNIRDKQERTHPVNIVLAVSLGVPLFVISTLFIVLLALFLRTKSDRVRSTNPSSTELPPHFYHDISDADLQPDETIVTNLPKDYTELEFTSKNVPPTMYNRVLSDTSNTPADYVATEFDLQTCYYMNVEDLGHPTRSEKECIYTNLPNN